MVANEFKFGIWQISRAIFKGLGYLVVGFIAFFLLIFAISLILAMMGISFLGLGIGFTGLVMEDFLPYLLAGKWQMWVSYIAGTMLLILPFSIVTILCLKLFSKNGYQTPRFWVLTNVFAFFLGVFGITLVVINTISQFSKNVWAFEKKEIAPTNTLSLSYEQPYEFNLHTHWVKDNFSIDEAGNLIRKQTIQLNIKNTPQKEPYLIVEKRGKGKSVAEAGDLIQKIEYPVKIEDNRLIFPKYFICGKGVKMRDQRVMLYLHLPEGTKLTTSEENFRVWNKDDRRIHIKNGDIYKMTKEGLVKE